MLSSSPSSDREQHFQSEFVSKLSWIWIIVNTTVLLAGAVIHTPASFSLWLSTLCAVAIIGLVALLLNRFGYTRTASYVLPGCLFLYVLLLVYYGGGTVFPGILNFVPIILTTGFLLGKKHGLIMMLLSIAAIFAIAIMETYTMLPPIDFVRLPMGRAISFILPIVITFSIQYFSTDHIANAQAALEESEKKYRLLFENNPVPMWMLELPSYQIVNVNNAAIIHYGYTRDEFLTLNARQLRPIEDLELFEKRIVETERQGTSYAGKWRHKKKNGELITVDIVTHDIKFETEKLRIVLVNDVTRQEQALEELKRSEGRLAQAQN